MPNSIKVALAIGYWQFGNGRLRIQNNTIICSSDHKTINSSAQSNLA